MLNLKIKEKKRKENDKKLDKKIKNNNKKNCLYRSFNFIEILKDSYFKIVGYSDWYKQPKYQRIARKSYANMVRSSSNFGDKTK